MRIWHRKEFEAAHPVFAKTQGDPAARERFLRNHPEIAQQWYLIRRREDLGLRADVAEELTNRYGTRWAETGPAGEAAAEYAEMLNTARSAVFNPTTTTTTTTTDTTAGSTDPLASLTGDQRNAYTSLVALFTQYGLGEGLAAEVLKIVQMDVRDAGTAEVLLRETEPYRERFKVNVERQKRGLNALSIAEILDMETQYASIMSGSGLPSEFWDEEKDTFEWMVNRVAPAEVQERVERAWAMANTADTYTTQALEQFYGIGKGEIVAYFLDQDRARSLIETRQTQEKALIGSEALRQGLSSSTARIDQFHGAGVTRDQAREGFGYTAEWTPRAEFLSGIHGGEDVNQTTLEDESILGLASAKRARERLRDSEIGLWSGSSGRFGNQARSTSGTF